MLELKGKHNTAKVFTENVDNGTIGQIIDLCNQEIFKESNIAIMPDCHVGKGCTIGTTMTIKDKVVPNLVGVDIGCGVIVAELKVKKDQINFAALDHAIRKIIPSGFNVHKKPLRFADLCRVRAPINIDRAELSIGTLGGGNHFIELAENSEGIVYLIIHSGSRYMGKQIAEHYQKVAISQCANIRADLAYVSGESMADYLHDMDIAQKYAELNRETMVREIIYAMDWRIGNVFQSIHNYIDIENMILRKGAVSAQEDEDLIIPLNMRDGSIIARGKGNSEWNYSAPHGAGRILSRSQAKKKITLEEFESKMQNVWSTSVLQSTLDEAPMAYKPAKEILNTINDTVEVIDILRPIYNFKAN